MRPLDRTALAALGAVAAVAAAAVAIGDRVGLQAVAVTPARGAGPVSTLSRIEVRFSESVDADRRSAQLAIDPPIDGALRWGARTLLFEPHGALSARTRYTVRLDGTLQAVSGRRLHAPVEWSFETGALRIAYVTAAASARNRIAARTVRTAGAGERESGGSESGERTLASFERPVRDFHRAPDGGSLVATLGTDGFAADLWLIDLRDAGARELLDCGGAECNNARWAPDGTAVVFSQRRLPLPPRPWLVDPRTGDNRPLLEQEVIGFDPRWSSDGAWVAFVSPLEGGLRIAGADGGRTVLAPTRAAAPAAWRPGALTVLTTDLREGQDGQFADVIISIDLADLSVRTPLGAEHRGGRSPAWAPDGARFAFIRMADQGEQVWMATAAGGPQSAGDPPAGDPPFSAEPLVTAPRFTYREIVFSPGGGLMAVQRSRLDVPYPQPEVVVFDLTGRAVMTIVDAATPRWLP